MKTQLHKRAFARSIYEYMQELIVSPARVNGGILDLADTETGEVWIARNREHNCGHCGKQEPTSVKANAINGTRHFAQYIIGNFIAGDTITVKIQDEQVVPIQETSHVATMQGFTHELVPFYHNHDRWDKVCLNPIYLIDKDYSGKAFDSVPRDPKSPKSLGRVMPEYEPFLQTVPNKKYSLPREAVQVQLEGNVEVYFSAKDNSLLVVPIEVRKDGPRW